MTDTNEDGHLGAIDYHENDNAQAHDFYKYGQEYADCALEEIKPRLQNEDEDDEAEECFIMQH